MLKTITIAAVLLSAACSSGSGDPASAQAAPASTPITGATEGRWIVASEMSRDNGTLLLDPLFDPIVVEVVGGRISLVETPAGTRDLAMPHTVLASVHGNAGAILGHVNGTNVTGRETSTAWRHTSDGMTVERWSAWISVNGPSATLGMLHYTEGGSAVGLVYFSLLPIL